MAIVLRSLIGDAKRLAARHDRDAVDGIGARHQQTENRVTALVVRHALPLGWAHHQVASRTEDEFFECVQEVLLMDAVFAAPGCQQRRLIDQIAKVGADQTRGGGGNDLEIDVGRQRYPARMYLEDRFAANLVGRIDGDAAIEAAWTQQRLVEHVRSVGRREHDHAFA